VKVNGEVATLGQKADPETDEITVDGKVLQARQEMLYYVMNKPTGVITTNIESDPSLPLGTGSGNKRDKSTSQRTSVASVPFVPSVRDLLPPNLRGKIYPIGRLDKDSEGLLLFSNDGVLAYRLTHPTFDHEKEYEVMVTHLITDGQLQKLRGGMTIMGEKTKPAKVTRIGPSRFRIAITEGKNRQIRRMCQKVGAPVATLKRVRIMTLSDTTLKPGKIRALTATERAQLLASVKL
jgi:pseudouridine synthase